MRHYILDTAYEPFICHMRNRIEQIAKMQRHAGLPAMVAIVQRIRFYADTGDTRHLVDIANIAMVEFRNPENPKAHYSITPPSLPRA